MARASARFRISVKDHQTSSTLKVELIEGPTSRQDHRYRLRVNGRDSEHIREANLTYVFDRVRR
jgi:hypothetical protein